MNMAEEEMRWFAEANSDMKSCTGKPADMGGIPHELGSTGIGVGHATMVAIEYLKLDPSTLTFAVEGFGNVGWFVSKFLTEAGAKLVAVSDSKGVLCNNDGIIFKKLAEVKKKEKTVTKYNEGKTCTVLMGEEFVSVPADILITAAIPDLVTEANKDQIKAKIIVQGSNIPMSAEVEEYLHKKGILVVPDFVANAGGVISSYVEFIGGTEKDMFKMVEKKIVKNTTEVLEAAKEQGVKPRDAGLKIAVDRIKKAMDNRK